MEATDTKKAKTHRLDIRVNDDEYRVINEYAKLAGIGMSEYVRRRGLDKPVVQSLGLEERTALIELGRTLNEAMKLADANDEMTATLTGLIDELKKILTA